MLSSFFCILGGVSVYDAMDIVLLKHFLDIPSLCSVLEKKLQCVSENYYKEHSFVGSSQFAEDLTEIYQRPISPYLATVEIIGKEKAIQAYINKLERRYQLFADEFTTEELESLKTLIKGDIAHHDLLDRAVEQLEEIRAYIEYHNSYYDYHEDTLKDVLNDKEYGELIASSENIFDEWEVEYERQTSNTRSEKDFEFLWATG